MNNNYTDVIRLQLNEDYFCEIKKYIGSYGEYYCVNNIYYDIHFPIEWVFQTPVNIDPGIMIFGPETCYNCFQNGYHNGVFIGYCINCAYLCNYTRGNGIINGIEMNEPYLDSNNSIFNLYLQTLESMDEIGDRQLNIDYYYKRYHAEHILLLNNNNNNDDDNDANTVHYDDIIYSNEENDNEDDITIAFSAYTPEDFVDTDSFENDYYDEIDSIS